MGTWLGRVHHAPRALRGGAVLDRRGDRRRPPRSLGYALKIQAKRLVSKEGARQESVPLVNSVFI